MGQPWRASFLPSRDGFRFTNSWPDEPAVSVATPFGRVGVGNAARGLCGGMVFGALDFWHAGCSPPASRPAPGEPLFRFIVRRLVQSWHIPVGVARYYYWMNLPDQDAPAPLTGAAPLIGAARRTGTARLSGAAKLRRPGLAARTIAVQWPRVKARIDAGEPAALGVVTVASADPLQLGHNHQVLGYAYRLDGTRVTLHVYDPNSGPADDVYIRFDMAAPDASFTHSLNIGRPVRGLFLTSYAPATPPGIVRPQR
jgi:hypothetical protein